MDTFIKVIGLLSALLALTTAFLAYRQKRIDARTAHISSLTVLEVDYGTPKRWRWLLLQWCFIPLGLVSALFTVNSIYVFLWKDIFSGVLGTVVFGACTFGYGWAFAILRRDPLRWSSKVKQSVRVKVKGKYEDVFRQCQAAVQALGCRIETVDFVSGRISARTTWNWRSYGERLQIKITVFEGEQHVIDVASDSVLPFTLVDLGKNKANIRRLIDHL